MRQHPEVDKHRAHGEQAAAYRRAVAAWREAGEALPGDDGRTWTVARARSVLDALVDLFAAYNRILWRQFPYCGQCLGGCCVVDAADVRGIDYVALALREERLPQRPERSPVNEAACIYLTPQGCSWPAAWRPIKCATFYCLGSGDWRLDAADARYEEVTEALHRVVAEHLPAVARHVALDERALLALLPDPVAFAGALAARLDETLVASLRARYPAPVPAETPKAPGEEDAVSAALAFIADAAEEAYAAPPPSPDGLLLTADRLLEDLETLQWVLLGRPARGQALLREMAERYGAVPAPAGDGEATLWHRMRQHIEAVASSAR